MVKYASSVYNTLNHPSSSTSEFLQNKEHQAFYFKILSVQWGRITLALSTLPCETPKAQQGMRDGTQTIKPGPPTCFLNKSWASRSLSTESEPLCIDTINCENIFSEILSPVRSLWLGKVIVYVPIKKKSSLDLEECVLHTSFHW